MKLKPPLAKLDDPGILANKEDQDIGISGIAIVVLGIAVIVMIYLVYGKEKGS